MSNDSSWITEALIQFTRSPVWRTPVNDFVDENCGVFNNDEEMKLEYTVIHNQYIALVDNLLTSFVEELGVSLEDALTAVKSTLADPNTESYKPLERVINSIFMVEDFFSFHRMMVKRNIELDILATQALKSQGVTVRGDDHALPKASSGGSYRLGAHTNSNVDEETALKNAIAASLTDQGMESKKLELEDAELQEALALSIQTEKERARQSAERVEKEVQQIEQHDLVTAQQMRVEKLTAIEEQKELTIEKLTTHTMHARREKEKRRKIIDGKNLSAPASPSEEEARHVKPSFAAQPAPAATSLPKTEPVGKPTMLPSALPPIGGAPLPPIPSGAPLIDSGAAARPAAPAKAPGPSQAAEKPKQPNREELEMRAKHMKEQRSRILAQNKAQRQQELTNFANQNGSPAPENTGSGEDMAQKQLTIDIARRFREDMVREATKRA